LRLPVAFWLGSWRSEWWDFSWLFLLEHLPWFLLFTCLWLLLSAANDLYDSMLAASIYLTVVGLLNVLVQFVAL
jgi:uncharacterized membrane protein YbhN (UPF0104 family)